MRTHTCCYCHTHVSALYCYTAVFRYQLIFQTGFVAGASKARRFDLSSHTRTSVIGAAMVRPVIETLVHKDLRHRYEL